MDTKIEKVLHKFKNDECNVLLTNTVDDLDIYLISEHYKSSDDTIFLVASNLYNAQKLYDKLRLTLNESDVSLYPADELITTELLAVSSDLKTARLQTLYRLQTKDKQIVVTHTAGLVRKIRSKAFWESQVQQLKIGQVVDKKELTNQLLRMGYRSEYQVEKPGDYSVRGYILDVFPVNQDKPIRIEFFDDEVESMRHFNLDDMRSTETITKCNLYPNTELIFTDDESNLLVEMIRDSGLDEKKEKDIFRLEQQTELDYLQKYVQFVEHSNITQYARKPLLVLSNPKRIKDSYLSMINDIADWYIADKIYHNLSLEFVYDVEHILALHNRLVFIQQVLTSEYTCDDVFNLNASEIIPYNGRLDFLKKDISLATRTVFLPKSKPVIAILDDLNLSYRLITRSAEIVKGEIHVGMVDDALSFATEETLCLSTSSIIKQEKVVAKKHFTLKEAVKLKTTSDIKSGDFVVHYDYGIGEYKGVKSMEIGGVINDYIHIAYREEEMLYVPVENVNLLQKYIGSEGAKPRLNSIGGSSWAKTKARVKKKLKDIASKLIKLYAERKEVQGFSFLPDDEEQHTFEDDFVYQETEDQLKAIKDVKYDMEQPYPMDRLICGDVGYGKTEVAMRAAFKAVHSLKQVAYLCPTTVLSKQHFKTFRERFSKYGIKIALLNRFVTQATQKEILRRVKSGEIDIVIGTHRLLSKDISFHDLGLLIIDEEQRFGVEHKETIKEWKVNVDVISLSATPIPRTLQMSLMGVKSTSLLETPPMNRYPVQTYVLEENMTVIKDAVEREMARSGQVFILYNRVSNIQLMANKIQRLVPDATVRHAHGQMSKVELDDTMNDFVDGQFNVLVCTTIIETGIDIPNANTLIILNADKLGLAQLYQIRGRVGRSDRIAYAYLMYKGQHITEKAEKRLSVIKEFTELGSGFKIALRDLNIRGAGDVLGAEQSGFIDSVGFDLYMQMLDEELKEQQGVVLARPEQNISSNIQVSKHIPDDYTTHEELKIDIHRKIKEIESKKDVKRLIAELADMYGYVPEHLITFMHKTLFDKFIQKFDVDKIEDKNTTILLRFSREGSNSVQGDHLLMSAFKVSRNIDLSYKNNRISILYKKEKRSHLEVLNEMFEYYEHELNNNDIKG